MRRRAGFTLIELLVVIAVLALLVAILVPSLRRARDLAVEAVCASNLRGLGSAVHLYANDADGGRYPTGQLALTWRGWELDAAGREYLTAAECLSARGYAGAGQDRLFECPGAPRTPPQPPGYSIKWALGDHPERFAAFGQSAYRYVGAGNWANDEVCWPYHRNWDTTYYTPPADEERFYITDRGRRYWDLGMALEDPPGNPWVATCPYLVTDSWQLMMQAHRAAWRPQLPADPGGAGLMNCAFRDGSVEPRTRFTRMY